MGFFFDKDPLAPEVTKAQRAVSAPRAQKAARVFDPNVKGCDACSLRDYWHRMSSAQMPAKGRGDILILGESPDADADAEGAHLRKELIAFVRKQIPGREQDRLVWQSALRCSAAKAGQVVSPADLHACSTYLENDVIDHDIKAIIGLGNAHLKTYGLDGTNIQRVHGLKFPVKYGNRTVWFYPVLHPGFLFPASGGRKYTATGDRHSAYPVFRADLKHFFRQVDQWPEPVIVQMDPKNVLLPRTHEEALATLERMRPEPLGVDIETTALRPHLKGAKIITAALSDGEITMSWPVDHPEGSTDWGMDFLLNVVAARTWIAHNAAFEYTWFCYFGREQRGAAYDTAPFEDTMAQARLLHERESVLDLNSVSRLHLGTAIKDLTGVNAKHIMSYPLAEVLPYNGLDAEASALIFHKLKHQVKQDPYQRLLETIKSTSEMELLGLDFSTETANRLAAKWSEKSQNAEAVARTLYEVREYERQLQKEWNIASTVDVGEALVTYGRIDLPRTAKQYATDDQTLNAAAEGHPLIKSVLEYRNAAKMKSTYIDPILRAGLEHTDGRLHPGYTAMLTATLRLSSENPNIQNFPKRSKDGRELREMVIPGKGCVFASFDFKQLEARIIAAAAKDRVLCQSIIDDNDIHKDWRDRVLDVYPDYYHRLIEMSGETDESKVLKAGRDVIKTDLVFASFYGARAESVAERTKLPLSITQEIMGEFWDEFRGVASWLKAQKRIYADTGSIQTLTGLTRHAILLGNEPINNPIQGTAAAVVLEAQNEISQIARQMNDPFLHPRINIHDDLTFIFPDDERLAEYINFVGETMVKCRFPWQIVPLAVECNIGYESWAVMEEVASFKGAYIR